MKVLLTGGTGFIGSALTKELLSRKHRVTLLTRDPGRHPSVDGLQVLSYAELSKPSSDLMKNTEAVINLAGEPIAGKRWTSAQKQIIVESRVQTTRALVRAMREANPKPSILISASAVGFYGPVQSGQVPESSGPGNDFLATTCVAWEEEAKAAENFGARVVLLRTGIVLETGGGALSKMLLPFQLFIGGPLGSGAQWFPWIHRKDEIESILFALNNPTVRGPLNLAAPETVTMKEFCRILGKVLGRPSWAPVPEPVLRLLLGEMADLLLTGQPAVPQRLTESGYRFHYPKLEPALRAILKR